MAKFRNQRLKIRVVNFADVGLDVVGQGSFAILCSQILLQDGAELYFNSG